jgi:glycosyltransferase involved in cell wall biosynthesis
VISSGNNIFFLGRRFGGQRSVVRAAVTADNCVVELNPRLLTSWLVLLLRRARGKKSAVWGHAWPMAGREARTDRLKSKLRRLAEHVIDYTYDDAKSSSDFEPNLKVSVAPNALYRADYMRPAKAERLDSILWIGRLVPDKKPDLAIKAFALAAPVLAGVRLRMCGLLDD